MTENTGKTPNGGIDKKLMNLIEKNTRKVPYFYEEGVCDTTYIPVQGGEIRVFHHTPKQSITKRPLLFIPGFGTSMWAWREFSFPFVEQGEFYFLESREKKSSKFKNRFKTKITVKIVSEDIRKAILHLGLDKRDFVLFGTSYCGGAILQGLIDKTLKAPTIVLFDPAPKLMYYHKLISILRFTPPFIIDIFRYLLGKITLKGEKNETQRERSMYIQKVAVPWKWRKAGADMFKFNIFDDLPRIEEETLIFHGGRDKHHPTEVYEDMARQIPKARYFSTVAVENKREVTIGVVGLEFCKVLAEDGIPESLKLFEKDLV